MKQSTNLLPRISRPSVLSSPAEYIEVLNYNIHCNKINISASVMFFFLGKREIYDNDTYFESQIFLPSFISKNTLLNEYKFIMILAKA